MAADELRRCYDAWMNTPDAGRIRVRWFFVPPQTPWITDAYDYRSSNWDEYPGYDPPLGEESSTRQPFTDWADGTPPPGCDCCPRASLRLVAGGTAVARSTAGASGVSYAPIAWWSADALAGFNNNDPVAAWADSSGNGYALAQSDPTQQPFYTVNALNGKPAVGFPVSIKNLALARTLSLPSDCAVYVAGAVGVGSSTGGFALKNGNQSQVFPGITRNSLDFRDGTTFAHPSTTAPQAAPHVWSILRPAGHVSLRLDGAMLLEGGLPNTRTFSLAQLGTYVLPPGPQYQPFVLGEVIVLPYTPDATEDAYWTNYLKTRWGITP